MKIIVLEDGRWAYDWEASSHWWGLPHTVVDLNDASTRWLTRAEMVAGLAALKEAEERMAHVKSK